MVKSVAATTGKRRSKNNTENETETDIYKCVVDFEETEARTRTAEEDTKLYLQTCGNIRKLLSNILTLKSAEIEDKAAVTQKRVQACIMTSVLKKLNRMDKVRLLVARETLGIEKQKLVSVNLQFQNLLYEVEHLMSEYRKCKQYKSKDEAIELISKTEFLQNGPANIVSKFSSSSDLDQSEQHQLHLAMLEYELCQRIKLAKMLEQLGHEKKDLEKGIIDKKVLLDGMEPKLATIVAATKPLQDHLGLSIGEIRPEHKLACHLSDPLYLLYCNSDAYRQYIGRGMNISIIGNLEDVLQFNEAQQVLYEESEHEQDLLEDPVEVKKHRHRKGSQVDKNEEKKKRLLEHHPLSVQIIIKENTTELKMRFAYFTQLRLVTVVSTLQEETGRLISSSCAREVFTGESILNQLYDGDTGLESPNATNYFQLKRLGIASFESLIPQIGYAYSWAQKVSGLGFLNTQNYKDRLNKLRVLTVEETFRNIESRVKVRLALAKQLHSFENNVIPNLPEGVIHPKSTASSLTRFVVCTFQEFCAEVPNAVLMVENDLITSDDIFYNAIITRVKATLHAYIAVRRDYPHTAPLFNISIKHNGEHYTANLDRVRDMERAVNIDWMSVAKRSDIADCLMTLQLKYLCSYLDIFLETGEENVTPTNTVFFHNVRGRNRRRPYKFRKIGNGIFTQF